MRKKVTIPVNWTTRKSIKTQIAKTYYNRLDNILAQNTIYIRTGKNLVTDLLLTPSRYKFKSQRKELVEKLRTNLDKKRLSNLKIIQATIEETVDKKDYKIIFKSINDKKIKQYKCKLPIINKDKDVIEYLVDHIGSNIGMEKENRGLYITFAKHYSENLIFRAVAEFKELISINPKKYKDKQKYFTSIVHTTAHKMGREWILPCDKNCHLRNT